MAKEVFKKAGYEVSFHVLPYKRAVVKLFEKDDGIMMGIFAGIPGYEKLALTEVSYLIFPTTYFYNSSLNPNFSTITKIEQTKGMDVLVMNGTSIYENVITESGGKSITVNSNKQVFSMLYSGRAKFAHNGLFSGLDDISKNPAYKVLVPLPFYVTEITSGLVFREGASDARDAFLRTIKKMHKNGELLNIFKNAFKNYPKIDYKKMLPESIGVKVNVPKKVP